MQVKTPTSTCESSWVSIRPYKALQGELLNNNSKLTEIIEKLRDTKKLEELENDLTYTNEQRVI